VRKDPRYLVGIYVLLLPEGGQAERLRLEQMPGMQLSLRP
jgi:hypothetical protein